MIGKNFLFIFMLSLCCQTTCFAAEGVREIVDLPDPHHYSRREINLFFLTKIYPSSDVLSFAKEDVPVLMRMPALGKSVTTYETLKGVWGSLGLEGDVECGVIECSPDECDSLPGGSIAAISKVYELIFKLRLYGFERLIPIVAKKLYTKKVLPPLKWLAETFDELSAQDDLNAADE